MTDLAGANWIPNFTNFINTMSKRSTGNNVADGDFDAFINRKSADEYCEDCGAEIMRGKCACTEEIEINQDILTEENNG